MNTTNSKIIVSYNGGSAGDLFVKSCNNEPLTELIGIRVSQVATLKNYENKIRLGENVSLVDELNLLPYQFVNTHLLDEVVHTNYKVYNIVIKDPEVQLKTIYRQMQLQKLKIIVDTHSESWYTKVSKECLNGNYLEAAKFWFDKAKNLWLDKMEYRLQYTKAEQIDFTCLYTKNFVDDLINQGWIHNLEMLKHNHNIWLEKNQDFTYFKTISMMAEKLSTMNWQQQSGWIEYT